MTEQEMEQQERQNPEGGAEVYTFARPFKFEEQTVTEITINFDDLTGNDILAVNRQYKAESKNSTSWAPEMDKEYQAYIVAKAAGVHVGLVKTAPAKDFTRLTLRAQNFLLL